MNKPIMMAILVSIMPSFVSAQDNKLTIPVKNTTDLNTIFIQFPDVITTPSNVLVLNEYTEDASNLYYFKDNRFVWKGTAGKEYSRKSTVETYNPLGVQDLRFNTMVASNSGSWVYNIEFSPQNIHKKDQYITQFNKQGVSKKFTIEGRSELGKQLQTVFCDDQYFYYLATENGDELARSKKADEKLIINRFDANDFSYKRIVMDLPPIEPGVNSVFWSFLGQTDTEKFLVSKKIYPEIEKYILTIVAFDADGKITRSFTIEPRLNKRFIRPANAVKSPIANFYQVTEFDYHKFNGSSSYATIMPDEGSFANIMFDAVTNSFYIIGLSGPNRYQKVSPVNDGFYVIRYNLEGSQTWLLQEPVPADLANDGFFRNRTSAGYRNVYLQTMPDKSKVFHIQVRKARYSWPITDDGTLGSPSVNKDTQDVGYEYEYVLTRY